MFKTALLIITILSITTALSVEPDLPEIKKRTMEKVEAYFPCPTGYNWGDKLSPLEDWLLSSKIPYKKEIIKKETHIWVESETKGTKLHLTFLKGYLVKIGTEQQLSSIHKEGIFIEKEQELTNIYGVPKLRTSKEEKGINSTIVTWYPKQHSAVSIINTSSIFQIEGKFLHKYSVVYSNEEVYNSINSI